MRLGLISDVHEHVEYLETALAHFRHKDVDRIVLAGDVVHMGRRLNETCALLSGANVIGVWGNHDFGLCVQPSDEARLRYGDAVIRYMGTLQPRLVFEDCSFTHVEPWLDPEDVADLWHFEGPPTEPKQLDRIFAAVSTRVSFAGHYHEWMLITPTGIQDWDGRTPVQLDEGRYFVVLGALCEGHYAIFDTETYHLTPYSEAAGW